MREVSGDVADPFRYCVHGQGFEATGNVGDDLEKGIVGRQVVFPAYPQVDGGGL